VLSSFSTNVRADTKVEVDQQPYQQELSEIDAAVKKLEEKKNRYRASAARHEDEALRWQFQPGMLVDARMAWAQADQDREKMEEIQKLIDALQKRKAQILKLKT
ncbi:MAG TPA: hypothetical protein VJ112_02960, partial [Rhabdochlamydiaceae bacterium]|nr:hypothetical protein [Rhabdochlamydiaceae bacterium]